MSVPMTKIEATAVARFLSATHSQLDNTIQPHMTWLHLLARAYGYRNWNGIKPVIDEIPQVEKFSWGFGISGAGFRRFGIASVVLPGQKPRFYAVSDDTSEKRKAPLAAELAACISRAADFRGMQFRYTRPDPSPKSTGGINSSAVGTPMVCTATSGDATILLWWIRVFFEKPYGSADERNVLITGVGFAHWATYYERAPTDCFLEALTGLAQPPRRCLYVPVESSPPWLRHREAYHPLILTEGASDGEEAGWDHGMDRMLAVREAYLRNRQAGLSNLDIEDIADRHRSSEHDPNAEPEADIYWLSESDD